MILIVIFCRYVKDLKDKPSKQERAEISNLKIELANLKETYKLKDTKNSTTQARLRNQIKALEKETTALKEEVEKLTKQNAKLLASQKLGTRPSDTKMLHEINRNLSKLTKDVKVSDKVHRTSNRSAEKPQEDVVAETDSSYCDYFSKNQKVVHVRHKTDECGPQNKRHSSEGNETKAASERNKRLSGDRSTETNECSRAGEQLSYGQYFKENDRNLENMASSGFDSFNIERHYEQVFGHSEVGRVPNETADELRGSIGKLERH